ncbi:MAG: F0F1 ATP synthase subunit B, partial [Clostridiales bacterium]|nr:F0F1 ATP synthase subunit B [Clostridiales bacterium]
PDQFAGYLVTCIAMIINLLVAYLILKFALFKPLMKVMNARKESISKQITDAEEKETQAEEKLDEATRRMDASHEEAMQLIADARTQAEKQSETIIVTAKKEAQDIRDRAEEDAKGTRKAMLEEMKDEVADLAVSIAGRVLAGSEKGADEAALREKALQELSSSEVKTGD